MKQQQFATRQKSEELIKEIVDIWNNGSQKENLEGVEQDPIFGLIITALAHRTSEIESEIEMFKQDVVSELSRRLVPHRQCRAIPSATIIQSSIVGSLGERMVGGDAQFTLVGTSHNFVPLFDTLIVNGTVDSVHRIDGRRWSVRVATKDPLSTLRGLSFWLDTEPFSDLSISLDNHDLALVKPWDYANLPLSNLFRIDSKFYNHEEMFLPANRWIDLFAQLDSKLFYIGYSHEQKLRLSEREYLDFVFEFRGIDEKFELTQQRIKINAMPIVNIEESRVNISSSNPIVRLQTKSEGDTRRDFLGLLPPLEDSNDYLKRVTVRETGGDRFSEVSLYRLVRGIIERFSSDYYAFQELPALRDGVKLQHLYRSLISISRDLLGQNNSSSGSYLSLNRDPMQDPDTVSFKVRYLTTSAELVNEYLSQSSQFTPARSLSLSLSPAISKPLMGMASISDDYMKGRVARYNVVTQDRLVTPADVKLFCLAELNVRYGISNELIKNITVAPQLQVDNRVTQYVMAVSISVEPTLYARRTLQDTTLIENRLSRLMAVRSVGLLGFDVKIFI